LTAFPENVALLLLRGRLMIDGGDLQNALPLYRRAHGLDPQDGGATYSLAWLLHELQHDELAVPVIQQAIAQNSNRDGALYLLGTSFMRLMRWNEALHAFQQLLSAEPKYMADTNLLRLVRECKQKLGYELTDAERRAGRRWWPFGGKQKPAKLQAAPVLVRPGLKIAGIAILVVSAVSFAFVGWDRKKNIDVFFDNGLNRNVDIDLDGRHFEVPRDANHNEKMTEGTHTVVIREKSGREIERMTFGLQELSFFALMHDRFFVYNVASQRVYRRAVHGYAVRTQDSSYSEELIAMRRFFEQRDVDYSFQTPPDSISMDANASVERKISFNTAPGLTLARYAVLRFRQGNAAEAKTAIAQAAANEPCEAQTRVTQVFLSNVIESPSVASAVARRWIADCPNDNLEAHRVYQNVNFESGRQKEIAQEYRNAALPSPGSAQAHYLYGRAIADPEQAAVEFQRALTVDPTFAWARVALAHAYAMLERSEDAFHEYAAALETEGRDPSTVTAYATTAVSSGKLEEASAKIEELRKAHVDRFQALDAQWILAVASHDWPKASQMQKALESIEGEQAAWWRHIRLLRLQGDPSADKAIVEAMQKPALREFADSAHAERLLDKREFAEAATLAGRHTKEFGPASAATLQAYAAGGLLLAGDTVSANTILDDARRTLASAPESRERRMTAILIDGLRGSVPLDAVMAAARDNDGLPHAWFVAAVRAGLAHDRTRTADALAHCMKTASSFDFPYLEAKSLKEAM
jgi:tetratricopeptide (TPR) repeat protein